MPARIGLDETVGAGNAGNGTETAPSERKPSAEELALNELVSESGILTNWEFNLLNLVEMGLCRWAELKDGTLNLRDVWKMLEYCKIKNGFINWQFQRHDQERQAKGLIR